MNPIPFIEKLTTDDLEKMQRSYLEAYDHVTPETGAMIIRRLGEIRDELDRRGEWVKHAN